MRARFIRSLIAAASLGTLLAGAATATPPLREYGPIDDMALPDVCEFPLFIHIVQNNEYIATYFDRDGNPVRLQISGRLVIQVTRTDTGSSVEINASGPGSIDLVSGDFVAEGLFLQWGENIDGLNVYRGRHDFDGIGSGSVISVCDLLAG